MNEIIAHVAPLEYEALVVFDEGGVSVSVPVMTAAGADWVQFNYGIAHAALKRLGVVPSEVRYEAHCVCYDGAEPVLKKGAFLYCRIPLTKYHEIREAFIVAVKFIYESREKEEH